MNKYRLYPVITLIVLLIVFCLPVAVAAQGVLLGDVNGDGDINVGDVVLAMRFALDIETPTAQQKAAADVDGDGDVNVKDVTLIMRHALELIDSFPAEKAESDSYMWLTIPSLNISTAVIDGNPWVEGELKPQHWKGKTPDVETSRTVIAGYSSSGNIFESILYPNLDIGDIVHLDYQGIRYTYKVSSLIANVTDNDEDDGYCLYDEFDFRTLLLETFYEDNNKSLRYVVTLVITDPDPDGKPNKPFRQEMWVTIPTITLESPVITRLETREELDGNSIELMDPNTIPSNAGTNTSLENRKMEHLDNKDDPFVGVFSEITNLNNGDLIYLEYQGILYTYEVFRSTYEDFVFPEYGEIEFTIPEFVPEAITDEQLVTLCQIRYIYALDILAEVIPIGFYIQGRLIDIEDK